MAKCLSWAQLGNLAKRVAAIDTADVRINGATNSHTRMRLFGHDESKARVTLYRDNHAWCPYCQKIWLFLEEKKVPYKIEKVTMFCYGEKESWYKRRVPSGMLPAIEIDGQIVTESDDILFVLEEVYGPLYRPMSDRTVVPMRQLERELFGAWCRWLCYPGDKDTDARNKKNFTAVVKKVELALSRTPGPYFLDDFSIVDVVFTPYVERMNASLFYYKGYTLRDPKANPEFAAWFDAMESRATYRGTQSDFHTHCHDLPPQMGGCYENDEPQQQKNKRMVNQGPWNSLPDVGFEMPEQSAEEALFRTIKHKENIIQMNPHRDKTAVDEALRCALTRMMTGEQVAPPPGADAALRYVRDRVNVPRDMPIWSGKLLRAALEETAALAGDSEGPLIPKKHRRDQDPKLFWN